MAATRALWFPLLFLVALTSSCRSVVDSGDEKPVTFGFHAVEAFRNREFERIAAYPEIRRLASSRAVVVVWCESIGGWVSVKGLSVPAGNTLSETLRISSGRKLSASYGDLSPSLWPIAPSGISRVVILHQKQWFTVDGNVAVGSEEEAEHNPVLQPGTIMFVEAAKLEPPPWVKVK